MTTVIRLALRQAREIEEFNIQVRVPTAAHPLHSLVKPSRAQQPTWGFQRTPVECSFI